MNGKAILLLPILTLFLSLTACTELGASSEPTESIAPITIADDLSAIDLCQAIPPEDIEAVMGVELVKPPTRYTLRNTDGTSGCFYDGPTDSDRERHFGYVVLTPLEVYDNQMLNQKDEVSGIGDAAYFNNSGDVRELWVELNDKVAFVIAFGDVAREEGSKALAKLMIEAIR